MIPMRMRRRLDDRGVSQLTSLVILLAVVFVLAVTLALFMFVGG